MFCDHSTVLIHFKLGIVLAVQILLISFVSDTVCTFKLPWSTRIDQEFYSYVGCRFYQECHSYVAGQQETGKPDNKNMTPNITNQIPTSISYGLYDDGTGIPYFNPRPNNLTYYRGDTAVLQCSIQHLGTKTVIWRRASDPFPVTIGKSVYVSDTRFSIQEIREKGEWNLVIKNAAPKDTGVYECQVSSTKKIIWHILLKIKTSTNPQRVNYENYKKDKQVSTEPVIHVSGTQFVEKGDPIHIVCNATGIDMPPTDLDWFKDGIKITPDAHQKITIDKFQSIATRTLVSVLELNHSNMKDAGTYVCRSSNLDITSIKVHVLNAGSLNVKRGTSTEDEHKKANGGSVHRAWSALPTAVLLLTVINAIH